MFESPFAIIATKAAILFSLRYFLFAGVAFLIWYYWFGKAWLYKKIQPKMPTSQDYIREISHSLLNIGLFVGIIVLVFQPSIRPYTQLYKSFDDWGWTYWGLSLVAMIFLHDTYFYWIHRLMHHPKVFRWTHRTHHESINPTPWTSLSFGIVEGILEVGIIPIIVFTIPCHLSALVVLSTILMLYNVYGHLGYEILPKGTSKHWLGKWLNTSVAHNLHHHYYHGNYGLYFLFWDRWLGTMNPNYDAAYDEVKNRIKPENNAVPMPNSVQQSM